MAWGIGIKWLEEKCPDLNIIRPEMAQSGLFSCLVLRSNSFLSVEDMASQICPPSQGWAGCFQVSSPTWNAATDKVSPRP